METVKNEEKNRLICEIIEYLYEEEKKYFEKLNKPHNHIFLKLELLKTEKLSLLNTTTLLQMKFGKYVLSLRLKMKVVIIKYNAGNVRSVLYALERLGVQARVSDNLEEIRAADKVIFPGVGEASTAMTYLKKRNLDKLIVSLKQPVLGICLGQQLMCIRSEEGNVDCLGIFPLQVKRFRSDTLKIPQMGWNDIFELKSQLFCGIKEHSFVYFVHGYYVEHGEHTIATTDYALPYSAALQKDNFFATQFHLEKSGDTGHEILGNFLKL